MTLMNSLGTEMITILYANNCCSYLSSNVEHCKSKESNCFLSHDGGQRLYVKFLCLTPYQKQKVPKSINRVSILILIYYYNRFN